MTDKNGRFGVHGGQYIPETLMNAVIKLPDTEGRIFMSNLGAERIREAFTDGKAFIPFITCGDPDLETTGKLVRAAVKSGADLIELGIPFSDPTAEGPVIQGANIRALQGGVTTDKIFNFVREL